MKLSRVLVSTALAVVLGGCPTPPPNPPEEQGPFLSDTPLWMLEAPESLRQSCFGSSIALGDVNGDGKKDLVVAAPPCSSMTGKGSLVLYAGNGSSFSDPIIAELDWQNSNPSASGRGSVVSIGNVNGDGFADILVRSQFTGTLVFAGKADLGAVLQQPLFRVPFIGVHYAAFLSDLNGDGLDDLVVNQASTRRTSIYRATPAADAPFTLVRTFPERAGRTLRTGDLDGDGTGELLLVTAAGSQLYPGCKIDEPGICEGGLRASPTWTAPESLIALFPDQNGDGHREAVLGYQGRVAVHLFQPEGGISPASIWSIIADPAYPGLSLSSGLVQVGDLDKDNRETEFLLSAFGRLYAFFPKQGISADMRPDWAWPKSNSVGPEFPGLVSFATVGAGDLNGDGYADFLAGLAPPVDQLTPTMPLRPGRVVAYGGGKVPALESTPFLRLPAACGLSGTGGKPDVTVDADVISRSMYIERRNFPEAACEVTEHCVGAPGDRRLLRFSVSIPNLGSGAVSIPPPDVRPDLYQFDSCHQHEHLVGFASYELLTSGNELVAVGRKQGFFLVDLVPYCGDAPAPFIDPNGAQGISPGWADVYAGDYPCQWLDITDVPDGTYALRIGVDKSDIVDEEDVHPNSVDVRVKISGTTVEVVP
ncbi:FG-GAP repeat protein [Archangium gephyra]|uniref:FG-GAP repeat protein n=1 Tax=Archangium gephyra TaxID=48 RepID=A0ABX9KB67_9BACT|nr:lysyl oxidase family protein [Archangium gephyra]REG37425.1 FG-GAP repeat protein [Archangium gephyra]